MPFIPLNPNMDFNQSNKEYAEQPSFSLMSAIMEDIAMHREGKVEIPDTTGVDCFFVTGFISDEMFWDFEIIEAEFMKHCYNRLQEFGEVQWYSHEANRYTAPKESHKNLVVGLMLNGAKLGDEYCIALLKNLHKTYYKKEYKYLKRFRNISLDEIMGIAGDGDDLDLYDLARVVTMCSIYGIELDSRCYVLYRYLNKRNAELEKEDDESMETVDFTMEDFMESQEQIRAWAIEDRDHNPQHKWAKAYRKMDEFVANCLRHFGYPEDYIFACLDNDMCPEMQWARTYSMLKLTYPNQEFTYDEVLSYAHLYTAIAAIVDISDEMDSVNRSLLGMGNIDEVAKEECLFDPDSVVVSQTPKKPVTKTLVTTVKTNDENIQKEDYLAEIDELRRKLSKREMEYQHLKTEYAAAKAAKKEAEAMLSQYENDREELIALRETVYNLELEDPDNSVASVEEMKALIADKDIAIIGGHINWINKLKQEFPDWTYISVSDFKAVDVKSLDNKEMLFFFTDYISHTAYGKFIAAARERKIPFAYLHGVNLVQMVKIVWEKVK